ncbi:MAG TPA: type II toxin-antitoxin system YafQ family toxin [Amaricoccus sp.]|jgi:mRNA interferase YafQ|nr:type II toxin-antitoxin system YafQ family toxin [Amaricoccus sp.]
MRRIARTARFKRDYKALGRSVPGLDAMLADAVGRLVRSETLPERYRDHPLTGDWKGFRDCHLRPDLVLIYQASETELTLVRLGSHSDLFG